MNHDATPTASSRRMLALTIGSIGVVYGDIGTSPLYAFRESLAAASGHGVAPDAATVLGLLSLIFWTVTLVVTLKYVALIMRADNQGEGGILSLMALAQRAVGNQRWLMGLGMAGCALFFGDAVITPAISVLSALEGLSLITPRFNDSIVPLALVIMVVLFVAQRYGTARISRFFSPIMILWFIALALGGLPHIADQPIIWQAVNPAHAVHFLSQHGLSSLIVVGAVVLCVTGAEALYADMGHFGRKPIRLAWIFLVMPALLINYFGQGALVLSHPETAANAFFLLYPEWALPPMVVLAACATVIASQAVISGAYSLASQAMHLGLVPRLHIRYTSEDHAGQIYLPMVNWVLLVSILILIEIFRTSSSLASAYGIAVTGTMLTTTLIAFAVMRFQWRWPLALCLLITVPFVAIDAAFLGANLLKLFDGGFIPVAMAAVIVMMMTTWVRGSRSLQEQSYYQNTTFQHLVDDIHRQMPHRVEGTAIYLTSSVHYAPSALLQNLKHNKVLHEQNILLTLRFENRPHVPDEERLEEQVIDRDFRRLFMTFGYMDAPNVLGGLRLWRLAGNKIDIDRLSFFISRRNVVTSAHFGMPVWRDRLYIAMTNNASDVASYFGLPSCRVVELGAQMTV